MKPNPQMLFGNIFDDERITPTYLERFADDAVAKFAKNNKGNAFDTVLNPTQAALQLFKDDIGDVDTTLNKQVGKTTTLDGFIKGFTLYMRDNYVHIAAKLGGEKAAALIEFYPKGKTEYTQITKTKMPTVMERLNTAATNHAAELGATITGQLQGFQTQWKTVRGNQLEQKAAVKTNRAERSSTQVALEICLLKMIHFVGDKFPGDVEKCMTFFNFNLLFGTHRGKGKDDGDTDAPKA
jgi:hypothetical protein